MYFDLNIVLQLWGKFEKYILVFSGNADKLNGDII
jgi:hypothetical protein